MGKFMFVYITLPSNVTFHQYPHASTKKSVNYNQTCNYLCAVFPEAIPAIITEKVRGLHVITDFRPPKKNMRMRTGQPQTFLHRIFSCDLARNPVDLELSWTTISICFSLSTRRFIHCQEPDTVYISRVFFSLFLLISNFNKPEI